MPASVDSKPLTVTLSPLDATLAKYRGRRLAIVNQRILSVRRPGLPLLFGPSTTVPSTSPPGSPATAHHVLLPSPRLPCILSLCRFSPRRTCSPASVVCAVWVCLLARGGLASRDLSQPQRFFNPPPEMNWPWVFCFWSTNFKAERKRRKQCPTTNTPKFWFQPIGLLRI